MRLRRLMKVMVWCCNIRPATWLDKRFLRVGQRRRIKVGLVVFSSIIFGLLQLMYSSNMTDVRSVPSSEAHHMINTLPSTRHTWYRADPSDVNITQTCLRKRYRVEDFPDVSVILTMYNTETPYWIYHTLHALRARTPPRLLREIIIVDDNTSKPALQEPLHAYIGQHFGGLVRIVRSNVSLGLSRARNLGFRAARGGAVAVIDIHMEVQEKWLEPLLEVIVEDRRTLASSYLDWIFREGSRWNYDHGPVKHRAVFGWDFEFGFMKLSKEALEERTDPTKPIRSPSMCGGMYVINRRYLQEIGYYDDGLTSWGGDNFELPIKVWRCGGRVLLLPCSRIAHPEPMPRSYRDKLKAPIDHNYRRVIDVLYDEYRENSIALYPPLKNTSSGDIIKQANLVQKCPRSFGWYLQNGYPEMGTPIQNSVAHGGLQNYDGSLCLHGFFGHLFYYECGNQFEHVKCGYGNMLYCAGLFFSYYVISKSTCPVWLQACATGKGKYDHFFLTMDGVLRLSLHVVVFDKMEEWERGSLLATPTVDMSKVSRFYHWKNGPLIETTSGLCLQSYWRKFVLRKCDVRNKAQRWKFRNYTQRKVDLSSAQLLRIKQYSEQLESVKDKWRLMEKEL